MTYLDEELEVVGMDVGGTNTDAVLRRGSTILATVKRPTTADVTSGIVDALAALETESAHGLDSVRALMIGTTHFTNAIVETSDKLVPTACLRLGLPATTATPPLLDWPERLRNAIGGHYRICHGGHEFDGRELSPLDPAEIKAAVEEMAAIGVRALAVSAVFSPVVGEVEQRVADIVNTLCPEMRVSLSHEIGHIGLMERENATVINASLTELADISIDAFHTALAEAGLAHVPVYLSQNDGTLMDGDYARRYPVLTFASGPTNSMRGAAWLSGLKNCAVVDVGGTTTDIGILADGFPRPAGTWVPIGGVRTNFRMPDVTVLGLGGGSRVTGPSDGDGRRVTVGPDSVGHRLTSEALIFGGSTLTASDLAVAAGVADFGDAASLGGLDPALVRDGIRQIADDVAIAVDRMSRTGDPLPVVLVGGGSAIVGDSLPGFSEIVRPEHFAVANAVGASIAQVGAEIDRIYALGDNVTREDLLEQVRREAKAKAVEAGARADTVDIVALADESVPYMPDADRVRHVRAKAVGDMALKGQS